MRGWLGHLGHWVAGGLLAVAAIAGLMAAAPAAAQCSSEMCVAKSFSPGQVPSGGTSNLKISLRNVDKFGDTISNIQFNDVFPAGMTFVSAPANQCGGTLAPLVAADGVSFTGGFLGVGQSCVITAVVSVVGPLGTTLVNTTSGFNYDFDDSSGKTGGATGSITIGQPPSITSPLPPNGSLGVVYSFQINVAGSTPMTVDANGLPPGLAFDPATLKITGTPTLVGTFIGAITATNGINPDAVQRFAIVIGVPPLLITTPPSVFAAPVSAGTPLDVTLQAQGGVPPYTWDLAGGAPPPGVTLGVDGHLVGLATAAGTFVFTAGVTDSRGTRSTQTYTIVVVKAGAALQVTTAPSPVISRQTLTVTATLIGAVTATGTVDVWVAGSATRCPPPFKFGNPASPVASVHTVPLDATGKAQVMLPDLAIDDYGVCAHYSGDALYNEAFAGPVDAFVIKGVLLPAPAVALAVPAAAKANSSLGVDVTVTPVDASQTPGGTVEIRRDGQAVATVALANGVAHASVAGPVDASVVLSAMYMGDGMYPPAASPDYMVALAFNTDPIIPTLSQSLLALLAVLLGLLAARRLRR